MLASVQLDNEICLGAYEVDDRVSNHFLAQKPVSVETFRPQSIPKQTFGVGRVVAHVTREMPELVSRVFGVSHGMDDMENLWVIDSVWRKRVPSPFAPLRSAKRGGMLPAPLPLLFPQKMLR